MVFTLVQGQNILVFLLFVAVRKSRLSSLSQSSNCHCYCPLMDMNLLEYWLKFINLWLELTILGIEGASTDIMNSSNLH